MNSFILTGRLMHRRQTPLEHSFTYPVYSLLLNLDDLPELERKLWLFGYNRPHLVSIYDADHFDKPERSIKEKLLAYLARNDVAPPGGQIYMLTNARILGYVFNPVSFFYCYNSDGELAFIVAEVNNTFGERYPYLLTEALPPRPRDERRAVKRYAADKRFYVSPLIGMEARYEFAFSSPLAQSMFVQIDEFQQQKKLFQARLWGDLQPLTNRTLRHALLRYPFMSLQIMTYIHWQAIKTYLRGVPFIKKPESPPAY
ncbi:MAG: DUF1365 domain-containing protein [Ardenticatenaceae bacterium]